MANSISTSRGRPPISTRVIRVGGAIALPAMLRERGVDADALFAEAGLPVAVFDHADNVIPFAKLGELAHLAAERTGLSDIGLRICMQTGPVTLGTVGCLVANAETVGAGLASLQSYLHLHDEGAAPYVQLENRLAILGYEVLEPDLIGAEQIVFGALAIAANLLREICGVGFALREVNFAHRAPSDTSAFAAHFAAPVRFDADRNAVVFDAGFLGRPIAGANAPLRDFLASQIREKERLGEGEVARDRIRRVMRTLLATDCISQDEVARAFGMNRRTFARRLQENGTTFRELLDAVRFDAARVLLRGSAVSLEDVANRLGYADVTAFARAFRRWSGSSPAVWRRKNVAVI
ncbi:AraC family transcriptional regulator [Accumulibacter sp.]|uniref:AraC family transcriptional regulator n=1 Tax=Accumulibacter sp. TaxID=2053492 RepID=UPI0025DD0114|nr:AraC family transcriptional regulator [Accumulibacter sp.]MCM8595481.1 AraC family transcriptional regulator [Accumulibacter sp.]MDS4049628.1 AraC family transcriptional regulator [Accumulibacter sp.]